jgi:glycosyltransferase involved in cell wall biosynthesis
MKMYNKNDIQTNFALYGLILIAFGFSTYLVLIFFALFRRFIYFLHFIDKSYILEALWFTGAPIVIGFFLIFIDLLLKVKLKRNLKEISTNVIQKKGITVALTAYNDEKSIGLAVKNFLNSPHVLRVIVVNNNSTDKTGMIAKRNGAIVFNEVKQGYGSCVYRALEEASTYKDSELICLCEGDMTFRAEDLDKFLAYIPHADVVNGTRIVEQLQHANTQITIFMHYGNLAVAKLLEFKYLGTVTLTDVGTTYKLIRKKALKKILPQLNSDINLEFNPYLIEKFIQNRLKVIECPISFFPRIGKSKGGNISNKVAFFLGIKMIFGIIFGWKSE